MEPVKGGSLVKLPEAAQKVYDDMPSNLSNASYAIRFAASQDGIRIVLSGMSDMAQMKDNVSFMKDFKPLTEQEFTAIDKVVSIVKEVKAVPCTSCHYCVEQSHCPMNIKIPEIFKAYNMYKAFKDNSQKWHYNAFITSGDHGKASACIECGACEGVCPQHIEIRNFLKEVAKELE